MASTVVQQIAASTGPTGAASLSSGNFGSNPAAGNLIIYAVNFDGNGGSGANEPAFAISDTLGNAYTKLKSIFDATNGYKIEIGYAKNIAGGAANSVTVGISGSGLGTGYYASVAAWECSGLDTSTPFVAGEVVGQEQLSANTTANALTSGNTPTLASQPALVFGLSSILHSLDGPPTIGTGFTSAGATFWDFTTGTEFAQAEFKRVTATTAVAATFTPSNTGDNFFTLAAVFHEAGAAALASAANDTTSGTGALSTAIQLAGAATDTVTAPAALTTGKPLAGAASDTVTATGALTTQIKLAAAATDAVTATGVLPGAAQLASGATDAVSATGALTTAIKLASAATNAVTASAVLTNFTSVVLAAPLFTGTGGILDPNFWLNSNVPAVGDTIWYDPTFITIATNGEISAVTNSCSAIVEFNDGTGWAIGLVVITPFMVGFASNATSAAGALSTAIQLTAAASTLSAAAGALSTSITMTATAQSVTSATAALTTAIKMAAAAVDTTSGTANFPGGSAALAGAATDTTSSAGALTASIRLASAASDVVTAVAALTTQIMLSAGALTVDSATGALTTVPATLGGSASDTSSALATLTTRLLFAAAATDLTSAQGVILTQILALGAALDATSASGQLTTQQSPAGLYTADPAFTISVGNQFQTPRFPNLGPTGERVLTFNFGDDLETGEVLAGIIVPSIVCSAGTDMNPSAMFDGTPSFSQDLTQVSMPVKGSHTDFDYYITVTSPTSNPKKILTRYGLLPIRG